jgi:rod shape-determining protein MreC
MLGLLWRYRKPLSVAALFALAVYIVASQDKDEDEYNLLDHALVKVIAPLQGGLDWLTDAAIGGYAHYIANKDAAVKNQTLREELFALKRRLKVANEISRENHRLLGLINLEDRSQDVEYKSARVVANSTSKQWKSLRIDKGVKDGVRRGMGVVAELGLVGRIMAVDQHYSDVMLLSDTASSIDVIVGRSRARGRLRGLGEATSLNARIDYLTRSAPVEVGDEIVSSGAGVVFPRGVIIGYVRSVNRVEHGLYQEVLIEPAAALTALDEVLVVIGFGPEAVVTPLKSGPIPDLFSEDEGYYDDIKAELEQAASQPR